MVLMFLADGFEETEAIAPLDMLRRANADVKTVSISDSLSVKGAHGISVCADLVISDIKNETPEMIILPGGMPGTKNLNMCEPLKKLLTSTYENGGYVCAICAAPMVLGGLGLLKGKKATCFPGFEEHLLEAIVTNKKVVRDGKIITACGMGVAIEFGAELVAALKGKLEAERIIKAIQKD